MKRGVFFAILIIVTVMMSQSLGQDILIKISIQSAESVKTLSASKLKIVAKGGNYFLARVSQTDLQNLSRQGIAYLVLDQDSEPGLYYQVWCRPDEKIEKYSEEIEVRALLLDKEGSEGIIRGNPRKIEELTALGLSLRLIPRMPLPLEPKVSIQAPRISSFTNPVVDTIMQRVTSSELTGYVADLSGENSVIIGGSPYTIDTRYTYTSGCDSAAQFIKEKFESFGLSAWYDTFTIFDQSYIMDIVSTSSGDTAWAGGLYCGIFKTTNAGTNWTSISGTDSYDLWALSAPHPETLYGAGNNGLIIKSVDGGENWSVLTSPTSVSLRGTYFESPSAGWVSGYGGAIYFTTDGGNSWTNQSTGANNLYEIVFTDANNGWVVGQNGAILHTTNRGTNWNSQTSGTSVIIFGLDMATSQKGWICGQNGYLRYTSNGGTNWNSQTSGTVNHLYMVSAPDSMNAWAASIGGEVLHTTNAGTNWSYQPIQSNYGTFYEVYMVDTQEGWVTGFADIVHTTDGGQSWTKQDQVLPQFQKLNVVAELPGQTYPGQECLITAHYDATSGDPFVDAPGADDNGSGTAAVLAAANILKDFDFHSTLKFVCFAGEEQGLLGSYAYAQEAWQRGDSIVGVYNMDMLAWEGNDNNIMELHAGTDPSSGNLADIAIGVINDYSLPLTPQKLTTGATTASDHASFWDFGYPAILEIEDFQDFNPAYHTVGDLLSIFDVPYYTNLAKVVIASAALLADPVTSCLAKPGGANASGNYTLADVIAIVNYVFNKPGCSPQPLCWLTNLECRGDWNASNSVTLSDVIQAVNYVFNKPGGPWDAVPVEVCCL